LIVDVFPSNRDPLGAMVKDSNFLIGEIVGISMLVVLKLFHELAKRWVEMEIE